MKMLGNLGWRGRKRVRGRGRQERREEGGGKGRVAPAAFPDDPCGDTQLSSSLDSPPSPFLSLPFFPLYTTLQKPLQQNDFNEDILPQLRLHLLCATQIKSPPNTPLPPSQRVGKSVSLHLHHTGQLPTLSVMFMILLKGKLAEAVLSARAVNTANEIQYVNCGREGQQLSHAFISNMDSQTIICIYVDTQIKWTC